MLSNIVYNKSCIRYLANNMNMLALGFSFIVMSFVVRSFLIHCGNTLTGVENNQSKILKGIITIFNDTGLSGFLLCHFLILVLPKAFTLALVL